MTPEHWRQVRRLLEAALEQRTGERQAFLRAACSDDGLRREVESLLAVEERAATFIDTPLFDLHGDPDDGHGLVAGTRIGRYRVVEEIGRGGAGAVFLAQRADDAFDQRVAIKVLKRGTDTDEVVARFRAERQILARLEHPNIARLIDGGTTDDGLPYLVMEHVEGEPIDDYCNARGLGVGERLELLRPVCAAVHFAHQNLVVHRDIKPGNLLVTADGVPKLLDFGIAKLLDTDDAGGDTRLGLHRYTPEYAAPEQVRGEPVTTATDVYGLGAVLYELLSGRPPHGPQRSSAAAGSLAEAPITRPSTAVVRAGPKGAAATGEGTALAGPPAATGDPRRRRLRRALTGDLDNIALKALAPEPARRYPSAADLSDDLHRHLEGLPVRARGESFGYRAGRFLRRHRVAATAAALVVVLLIVFAVRETVLRRRAQQARQQAEAVTQFLVETLEQADPGNSAGETVTVRQMLDSGRARIRGDSTLEGPVRAGILDAMGRTYVGLGLYADAEPLLLEALNLRRRELGADHLQVAESHYRLARLYIEWGRPEAAESHLSDTLAIRRRRGETHHINYAKALNALAEIRRRAGELEEAERLHLEALGLKRSLEGDHQLDIATSLNNLANVRLGLGDATSAVELFGQALAIRRLRYEPPEKRLASTLNGLGAALEATGDRAGAERNYHEALEMQRRLYPDGHKELAITLNNLAIFFRRGGDPAAAEPLLREALAIQDRVLEPDHPDRAAVLRNLAEVLTTRGRPEAAHEPAREALEIFRARYHPGHWRIADAESVLGGVLAELGRRDEAEPLLVGGLATLRESQGERSRYTREAAERLERFRGLTGG